MRIRAVHHSGSRRIQRSSHGAGAHGRGSQACRSNCSISRHIGAREGRKAAVARDYACSSSSIRREGGVDRQGGIRSVRIRAVHHSGSRRVQRSSNGADGSSGNRSRETRDIHRRRCGPNGLGLVQSCRDGGQGHGFGSFLLLLSYGDKVVGAVLILGGGECGVDG